MSVAPEDKRLMRGVSLAAVAAITLGLGACDDSHEHMAANGKICATWKTPAAPTTAAVDANAAAAQNGVTAVPVAGDAAAPVDSCVKHWAYSLASSRDGADIVADAAMAACSGALSNWNQGAMAQGGGPGSEQSISTVTGQPTTAMAEHANFARAQALLYVVEARAGLCKPPAVVNGVPVGA